MSRWLIFLLLIFYTPPFFPPPPLKHVWHIAINPIILNIDSHFSPAEEKIIEKSIASWEQASQHQLQFQVNWHHAPPGLFKQHLTQNYFIWSLPNISPQFNPDEQYYFEKYLGVTWRYDPSTADIIIFPHHTLSDFHSTVLHELGHLLGLKHQDQTHTVMYEFSQTNCLTLEDVASLCQLYDCLPHPECIYYEAVYFNNID